MSLQTELFVLMGMSAIYFVYMYRLVKRNGTKLLGATIWYIKLVAWLNALTVVNLSIVVFVEKFIISNKDEIKLLVNLKSLFNYPIVQSILLSFFIFLFKFKEV